MNNEERRQLASFIVSEVISMYMENQPEYDIINQVEARLEVLK